MGIPPATGVVLRMFRFSKDLSEEAFARLAGVSTSTVSRWETAGSLSRDELVELLGKHLEIPPDAVDEALLAHRLGNLPELPIGPAAPSIAELRLINRAAAAGGHAAAETVRRELTFTRRRQRAAMHTAWAAAEWSRVKNLPPAAQDTAIRAHRGGEQSWALAVRLCEASVTAAAHDAKQAIRLARLAVSLAEAVPGGETWCLRLLGFCEPFLANACRVGGDLNAARQSFVRADELWKQGEGGDPAGLLDGTRRLDLKATFLQYDGQIEKALDLLEQALQGAQTEQVRGRLLIQKATSLEIAGEYEAAVEILRQAEPLIDARCESRLLFACVYNRAVNACHLDSYEDAASALPLIEALAQDLRTELDGTRVLWLRGRTRAGLGHREEAIAALTQVRRVFFREEIAYDFALVSLEIATLYLEQGRERLVKELAEEMLWIFQGQRIHQEALAALTLFCQAAQAEEAQPDRTRVLVKYLYRAQHNPSLRFESDSDEKAGRV
jgi:tetratricopeptide (TPR) repeat protein/DNA-binding XRE family transcriptional regulator